MVQVFDWRFLHTLGCYRNRQIFCHIAGQPSQWFLFHRTDHILTLRVETRPEWVACINQWDKRRNGAGLKAQGLSAKPSRGSYRWLESISLDSLSDVHCPNGFYRPNSLPL